MRKSNLILLLITASFLFFACNTENDNEKIKTSKMIPLEDFFKNPEKTGYKISPNGKYYSYLAPHNKRLNVFIQKIGEKEGKRITNASKRDIAAYFWTNDTKILYLQDTGGDENHKLFGVNIDGTDSICYTNFDKVKTTIIDRLRDIPNEIIIGLNKRNPQVFDAYRLYLNNGKLKIIAENPGNIQDWMTDHDGKLRVATALVDGINNQVLYRKTEKSKWKELAISNFKEGFSPYFFTFDNKNLIGVSNVGRDKNAVIEFDVNTKEEKMLYENNDYDVTGIYYSRKRKVLTSASYTSWKREKHYFDKESEKQLKNIEKQLKGYECVITGVTNEEDKLIVRTYSDRSLGAYYIYDKTSEKLEKITEVSPWLDENEMAEMLPFEYNARDGLKINGYITLPKGYTIKTAKKLPVIINPHGGPWVRDGWGFNPEIQFLANRGYAVLQMNYRGSTGYGKEFWTKSFKQWGRAMQDDVTDGTKELIKLGIADPEKIVIYGGSYGGYATLMGLIKEPDLYAAGIDYVGVSNLFTFMRTIPPYWEPFLEMMYEMVGNPKTDSLMMAEVSPVFNADKIKAPLFIAQGKNDPRVNVDESDQMVDVMKKRGINVEYLVKDDEGHGFRNEENRFDFYRAMEKFLDKNLKK